MSQPSNIPNLADSFKAHNMTPPVSPDSMGSASSFTHNPYSFSDVKIMMSPPCATTTAAYHHHHNNSRRIAMNTQPRRTQEGNSPVSPLQKKSDSNLVVQGCEDNSCGERRTTSRCSSNPPSVTDSRQSHNAAALEEELVDGANNNHYPSSHPILTPTAQVEQQSLSANSINMMYAGMSEHQQRYCAVLHEPLAGRIEYRAFPTNPFPSPTSSTPLHEHQRLFIGQLPYNISDRILSWLCFTFAGQAPLFGMEPIVRWRRGRQPSGCVHVYCHKQHTEKIMQCLNRRVLFDMQGVWVANNEEEVAWLESYCREMKEKKHLRPFEFPYQLVSVAIAESNYIPRQHHRRILENETSSRKQQPYYPLGGNNDHVSSYHSSRSQQHYIQDGHNLPAGMGYRTTTAAFTYEQHAQYEEENAYVELTTTTPQFGAMMPAYYSRLSQQQPEEGAACW